MDDMTYNDNVIKGSLLCAMKEMASKLPARRFDISVMLCDNAGEFTGSSYEGHHIGGSTAVAVRYVALERNANSSEGGDMLVDCCDGDTKRMFTINADRLNMLNVMKIMKVIL